MKKYNFRVHIKTYEGNDAGTKAVVDCNQILADLGFCNLDVVCVDANARSWRNIRALATGLLRVLVATERGSLVVVQYPVLGIGSIIGLVARLLRFKGCKVIALVHDLDALRAHGPLDAQREFANLNQFSALIVHNVAMQAWLREQGVRPASAVLGLFDYLADGPERGPRGQGGHRVAFAGSYLKSTFVYGLGRISEVPFLLYGPGFESPRLPPGSANVTWKGSFPPAQLPFLLEGDFGLIWDGDSLEKCEGVFGRYLTYNSPHKTSLYLVAGLPLIVPRSAAVANFVQERQVGLVLDSLFDLPEALHRVTPAEYVTMQTKVARLRDELLAGSHLRTALTSLS